jgi:hypothetical protein
MEDFGEVNLDHPQVKSLEIPRCAWKVNASIIMDFREINCEDVNWIELVQDRVQ